MGYASVLWVPYLAVGLKGSPFMSSKFESRGFRDQHRYRVLSLRGTVSGCLDAGAAFTVYFRPLIRSVPGQ